MFQSARLQLTAWYLLIIMCISMAFSAVIYTFLSKEVERFARMQRVRIERQRGPFEFLPQSDPQIRIIDPDLVSETKNRILLTLAGINGIIFLLSGGLGYILAGRTLQPIQTMVEEQHRFIQDASHELRTPLTALKSTFEVSLRDKKSTIADFKNVIHGGISDVNALQALSDALLQLAQAEKYHKTKTLHPNYSTIYRIHASNRKKEKDNHHISTRAYQNHG
jgi:signal transduction histidine kinase